MKIQYDIYTKYFTVYRTTFWDALRTIIHNKKNVLAVNIWLVR